VNRVLLVDDHAAFREPLAFMFDREPEFEVAGYPSCGKGAKLVGQNMGGDSGTFQCKFVKKPAKPTLVVGVEDLDGDVSNMASWQVKVK
jgi:DNA-binding NarL/FixJ family response regulator